jgi:hypothetical protein
LGEAESHRRKQFKKLLPIILGNMELFWVSARCLPKNVDPEGDRSVRCRFEDGEITARPDSAHSLQVDRWPSIASNPGANIFYGGGIVDEDWE